MARRPDIINKIAGQIKSMVHSVRDSNTSDTINKYGQTTEVRDDSINAHKPKTVDQAQLQTTVDQQSTTPIHDRVQKEIDGVAQSNTADTINAYTSAGQIRDAGGKIVTLAPLQEQVIASGTPAVANKMHTMVQEVKNSNATDTMNKYGDTVQVREAGKKATIVDQAQLQTTVDQQSTTPIHDRVQKEIDGVAQSNTADTINAYTSAGQIRDAGGKIVTLAPLQEQVIASGTPAVANKMHTMVQEVKNSNATDTMNKYGDTVQVREAGKKATIVDQAQLQTTVDQQSTTPIHDRVQKEIDGVAQSNTADTINAYTSAGQIRDAGGKIVTLAPLQEQVIASGTPAVANKMHTMVQEVKNSNATDTMNKYGDTVQVREAGKKATIVDQAQLQTTVDQQSTTPIHDRVQKEIDGVAQSNTADTINAYTSAGQIRDAGGKIVTLAPLQEQVIASGTPAVANKIVNAVGKNNQSVDSLTSQYPIGTTLLNAADKAKIVNLEATTNLTSSALEPSLSATQKNSFRSGEWDKLALQKIAAESKLFTPESLANVKKVVTDILEGAILHDIGWGDKQAALDKLLTLQQTGLIDEADVARLRWQYMLRDSLIDAQG